MRRPCTRRDGADTVQLTPEPTRTTEPAVVWEVRGELDLVGARALRDGTASLPDPGRRLYVDIRGVSFMDCSGLGALVELSSRAARHDVEVVVTGASRQVLRLLAVTGADRELKVARSSTRVGV